MSSRAKFLILITILVSNQIMGCSTPSSDSTTTNQQSHTDFSFSPTPAATQTPFVVTATNDSIKQIQNIFILSLADAGHFHLFAYSPESLRFTRLTTGAWDDITPALSPNGQRVAFASSRNGYWDLYLLSLESGEITRLTDTPEYEAGPSWSPDGLFITYEKYIEDNLEIYIISTTNPTQSPIRLTEDPASDHSPAWLPKLPGRKIAFISNRSGEPDVWIYDLDRTDEDRFVNISHSLQNEESHPSWSPDSERLAWIGTSQDGLTGIYIWDSRQPDLQPRWLGSGDWPIWQDNSRIVSRLTTPNQTFIVGYAVPNGELILPPTLLTAPLHGLSYGLTNPPAVEPFRQIAAMTPTPLYQPNVTIQSDIPSGRVAMATLEDVQAPYPQLHDQVDESFQALRSQVAEEVGWDALSSLENAWVPLTTPLNPGFSEDWLYTGRAFAINPIPVNAGMIAVIREDFGQQTYWRVYLRTISQDGSQGMPIHQIPWDLDSRYSGNTTAYEQGGSLMTSIPPGYWFDLTTLAIQYDWERLPALTNWRTYYAGIRFNEFVLRQGLDWRTAMLELYPVEALITPTIVIPPTQSPTKTPRWYFTPTRTNTPTKRPTFTP